MKNNPITQRKVFERYLTEAEESTLMRWFRGQADRLWQRDMFVVILLRQTGMRINACLQLTVRDAMDAIASGTLELSAAIQKRGHAHSVYLNKAALSALSSLLKWRKAAGYALIPGEPLICTRRKLGKSVALKVRSFQDRMVTAREAAGLTVAVSPHWLRHTLAKRVIERSTAKDPVGMAQIVLGHRNRRATEIYTLPDRADIKNTMEQVQ